MSRLTDLLRQARQTDPQLGADLEKEVAALLERRTFGLVFERHQPEAVELPGRAVRRGDKVRVLPPRGEVKQGDRRLWRVDQIERVDGSRVAHLSEIDAEEPEKLSVLTEDAVVVAEFRDRIFPGLVETGRVQRGGPDKPFHTVINAENYHALEMLTYTHRHSVDAIYIDPPYNTGAKDWKYNNDYVEGDDDYRHSKWLAFMERRLEIAKELLNPEDSVLIVTIDEKEYLRLGMLLEQTFPEGETQMITSVIKPGGTSRTDRFSRVEEFVYVTFFGGAAVQRTPDNMLFEAGTGPGKTISESDFWEGMVRRGIGVVRSQRPKQFYPILVDPTVPRIVGAGEPLSLDADRLSYKPSEGLIASWPIKDDGSEGFWQLSPQGLTAALKRGTVRVCGINAKTGQWRIQYMKAAKAKRVSTGEVETLGRDAQGAWILDTSQILETTLPTPRTVWHRKAHDASANGAGLLNAILPGRKFPFPKSLYAVEDALRFFLKEKPGAVVLDFFSGSGTTAHAVMRLNKQDGGRRQCISVTNNEVSADEQRRLRKQGLRPGDSEWEALGICDYITKPRVTAAITGRTPEGERTKGDYKFSDEFPTSEGFEENAAFFTLTYEDPLSVRHHRAFERVAPMLWLRAGSRGRVIDDLGEDGWDVADAYGVLNDIDQMADFVARVVEVETVDTVFVITDSDVAFQMTCQDLPERVTAVRLYESYLHNFMINRRAEA